MGNTRVGAVQRSAEIGQVGWLRSAPSDWRDAIIAAGIVRRFEAGTVVWQAGEEGAGLIGICTGTAAALHAMAVPATPMIHVFGPGSWAGQGPFLADTSIQLTLVARTRIETLLVPRGRVLALLDANPRHWRELGRLALDHSYLATNIAADLMIPDSRARCAATLLRLCNCRFAAPPAGATIEIGITQDELGAMANLSRASIGPILRDFVNAGLITISYRNIVLNQPRGLLAVAEAD
jgi:CRP-like cAMP-binding protein